MLGRKTYTQEELDGARDAITAQLAAYERLTSRPGPDFDELFFSNLTLALDRWFVHRVRAVGGKDQNPLNEVELLADSIMNNGGVLRGNSVIKLDPGRSVLGLAEGDEIRMDAESFERLANAFFAEIEARCVLAAPAS